MATPCWSRFVTTALSTSWATARSVPSGMNASRDTARNAAFHSRADDAALLTQRRREGIPQVGCVAGIGDHLSVSYRMWWPPAAALVGPAGSRS